MTSRLNHRMRTRLIRARSIAAMALIVASLWGTRASAQTAPSPPADTTGAGTATPTSPFELVERLRTIGLENLAVTRSELGLLRVDFENRRYRHTDDAVGHIARVVRESNPGTPFVACESRLGLFVAAVYDTSTDAPTTLRYATDPALPEGPQGHRAADTRRSLDLLVRPLFSYELGRLFDPTLIRLAIEPLLQYQPWPGGRATASLTIPLRNDFEEDSFHPDINRVRPGPTTLEQFVWLPERVLVSGTGGLFADNRYGLSFGAARPFRSGEWLLDAQADLTGFIAFNQPEIEMSDLEHWTGYAGVTWRPPWFDLAVRARGARFLYGDRGGELALTRSMGDLDVEFFLQRSDGLDVTGVRLDVPIPPLERPVGSWLRVLPTAQFPIEYRDEAQLVGRSLAGVANREEYLRQLNRSSLATNGDRYERARTGTAAPRPAAGPTSLERISLTGTSGFVFTPWAGTLQDRGIEVGYSTVPKEVAWDHRGLSRNDAYYAALGFLPHLEVDLRWTVIPDLISFESDVPNSRLVDSDRMLSARLAVLQPRAGRPGLAVGIEDATGTRRFHSTYAVSGIPFSIQGLQSRVALGYAFPVFEASRRTLDGVFGAVELSPWRPVAVALEHDTEKWNTSLGIDLGFGFRARAALLDLSHIGLGAGWAHAL